LHARSSSSSTWNNADDATLTCLQEHIDYLSLQSLLFRQTTLGFFGQSKLFFTFTKRLVD
jgi:hypothetical protein